VARHGGAGRGTAWPGVVRPGVVRPGKARALMAQRKMTDTSPFSWPDTIADDRQTRENRELVKAILNELARQQTRVMTDELFRLRGELLKAIRTTKVKK